MCFSMFTSMSASNSIPRGEAEQETLETFNPVVPKDPLVLFQNGSAVNFGNSPTKSFLKRSPCILIHKLGFDYWGLKAVVITFYSLLL